MSNGNDAIPSEIMLFLKTLEDQTLLIKGRAGTGKTTFALTLLREYGKRGIYITTRVDLDKLYAQHPWLKDTIPERNIHDATGLYDKKIPVDDERIGYFVLPEVLRKLYMRSERYASTQLIIIDSWEAVTEQMKDPSRWEDRWVTDKLRNAIFELIRGKNVNLVLVSEVMEETTIDFVVDGLITLHELSIGGRTLRELEINKLKGIELGLKKYLFTLHDGRFQYFVPLKEQSIERQRHWIPILDSETYFSTGSHDLDKILGGGYPQGSTVLLEVGNNVPTWIHRLISFSVMANFISQGRAVLAVPSGGLSAREMMNILQPLVGSSALDLVRVAEKEDPTKDQSMPYVVTINYDNLQEDNAKWESIIYQMRRKTGRPLLEFIGLDTQEARFGEEAYKDMISVSAEETRERGNLVLRLSKPGIESITQRTANVSDVHLKIEEVNGSFILYCEKPKTIAYNIGASTERGYHELKLTPIV
jgi:KaiC/GvpD/RAD55 family RecA-like ATPase